MSSINSNNSNRINNAYDSSVGQTSQTNGTSNVAPTTTANPNGVSTDAYSQSIGQASNPLATPAPVAADNKPNNYQSNLQGAQQNLASYSNGQKPTATETTVLAAENQASKPSADDKDTANRQKKAASQADSIVSSAEEGGKHGCKHKYDNHDLNVSKMQKLGFTKHQAEAMTHMLEDGRTPADVKSKLAYQLAAIGMTGGTSTKVNAPVAGNTDEIKKQLGGFAENQATRGKWLGVGFEMKTAGKQLDKMTVADMRTQYQTPTANNSQNTGTLGSTQFNLLGQAPTESTPSSSTSNVASTSADAISSTTQNQAAVQGAALGAAYPNLIQS